MQKDNRSHNIKLVECPRDAMQGWSTWIPTEQKIEYINTLLKVGFHTLDFGSFVSPKAIPQLADTKEVLNGIKMTDTKLLAIVANTRGAEEAVVYDEISFIGFPFSISETFQRLNTNSSIEESLVKVEEIQNLCVSRRKELVIYISMGFGNPYGDAYNADIAIKWVERLRSLGIGIFAMSDTVGVSEPSIIEYIYSNLVKEYPDLEFGAHFHSTKESSKEKLDSAFINGCYRFDSALGGVGGCPMAKNELVGNIATEEVIAYFKEKAIQLNLNEDMLEEAKVLSNRIFQKVI